MVPTSLWRLNAGGTGETFLYKDKQNNDELVAVKLIKRPLPKVIQANILREIMVSLHACSMNPLPTIYFNKGRVWDV